MAENENINTNNMHFFEGVEKLLEIWFAPSPANKSADLRKIPRLVGEGFLSCWCAHTPRDVRKTYIIFSTIPVHYVVYWAQKM